MSIEEWTGPESTAAPDTTPGPEIFIEGAAVASIMVPFVQAFMSKAGEDAYQAVRNLIRRGTGSRKRVCLYVISTDTDLEFAPPLPEKAIRQLAGISPDLIKGRVVSWDWDADTGASMWHIQERKPGELPSADLIQAAPETSAGPEDEAPTPSARTRLSSGRQSEVSRASAITTTDGTFATSLPGCCRASRRMKTQARLSKDSEWPERTPPSGQSGTLSSARSGRHCAVG